MMNISSYSWNGQIWKDTALSLELTDEVKEYNSKMVLVPMSNIIGANSIFLFQTNKLDIQENIINLQAVQIINYSSAVSSCEAEVGLYKEAVIEYEQMLRLKDQIARQERRKVWAYRVLTGALVAYIASYYL